MCCVVVNGLIDPHESAPRSLPDQQTEVDPRPKCLDETTVLVSSSYRRPIVVVLFLSARRLPLGHWVSMDWLNFWDGIISSWMMDGKRSQLSCQSVFSEFCSAFFFFSVLSSLALFFCAPPLFLSFLFRPLAESQLRSMLSTHTHMHREKRQRDRCRHTSTYALNLHGRHGTSTPSNCHLPTAPSKWRGHGHGHWMSMG